MRRCPVGYRSIAPFATLIYCVDSILVNHTPLLLSVFKEMNVDPFVEATSRAAKLRASVLRRPRGVVKSFDFD